MLNKRDRHHSWVRAVLDGVEPPVFTCEAVISEACFLLRHARSGQETVLALLAEDVLRVDFTLADEIVALQGLMGKFASVPMSLADACLVRMTELDTRSTVLTLDKDFKVYRRNRRQTIPTLMPDGG